MYVGTGKEVKRDVAPVSIYPDASVGACKVIVLKALANSCGGTTEDKPVGLVGCSVQARDCCCVDCGTGPKMPGEEAAKLAGIGVAY